MKSSIVPFIKSSVIPDADRFFKQGNFSQALLLYRRALLQEQSPEITQKIDACVQFLLKKYWRQEKPDDMERIAKECLKDEIELAYTRLRGREALEIFAQSGNSINHCLAESFLQPDLKAALLLMRQNQTLKEVAEGWLALSKNDVTKAFALFGLAEEKAPM